MIKYNEQEILNYSNINGYDLIKKIKEEELNIKDRFHNSELSKEEFYEQEMISFSKEIAYLMIFDYRGKLDKNNYEILYEIYEHGCLEFIEKKDFPNNKKATSKPVAFARKSTKKVYFEKYDNQGNFITFVRKNKQILIHEMHHLITLISSEKERFVIAGEDHGEYRPGYFMDEGLVEKSAKDFATKHNLLWHPCINYISLVLQIEKYMKKHNIVSHTELFNKNYKDLLNYEELENYNEFEFNELAAQRGINIDNNQTNINSIYIDENIDKPPYIKQLTDDKVINITGEGGSGKTTMTNYYRNNDEYLVFDYDLLIECNISDDCLEASVKREIIEKYGEKFFDYTEMNLEQRRVMFTTLYEEIMNKFTNMDKTLVLDGTQLRYIDDVRKIKGTVIMLRTSLNKCIDRSVERHKNKNPNETEEQIKEYRKKRSKFTKIYNPLMNELLKNIDELQVKKDNVNSHS